MKLHWGHGIVIGGLLFMAFILGMVVQMTGEKIDLVAPDYYEKGIRFQEEIEKQKLSRNDIIGVRNDASGIIFYSAKESAMLPQGNLKLSFYRPSNNEQDFELTVPSNGKEGIQVSDARLTQGFWKLKLYWMEGEKEKFTELEVYIK